MAIKNYKPTTAARRNMSVTDYTGLSKNEGTRGDVLQRQGIAGLNIRLRAGDNLVPCLDAVGGDDLRLPSGELRNVPENCMATKSGKIIEALLQVFTIFFSPASFIAWILFSSTGCTKGPFFRLLLMTLFWRTPPRPPARTFKSS